MTGQHAGSETRVAFHSHLDAIDDQFVVAGLSVAEALPRLSAGFLAGDRSIMEVAKQLARRVGDACEQVEDGGFVLLAREAPVAGDLRRLVALLRITQDVSRSANLLRHMCLTLTTFDPRFLAEPMRSQLEEMAQRTSEVFSAGMDAWRRRDALAVSELDRADEAVDELQIVLLREAGDNDDLGDEMLVLGLIGRYLERIADHGVEIARDAAFVATGERVRVGRHKPDMPDESDESDESDGGVAGDAGDGATEI